MSRRDARDLEFEVGFFEAVLRRERDYFDVMEILGGHYTSLGRVEDGLRMDRRIVKLRPAYATGHYNLACSLALAGKKSLALKSLRAAIGLGYSDHKWMREDKDLLCLKEDPTFMELLAELKSKKPTSR